MNYKILNWNVNGLRSRVDQLAEIIRDTNPDIIAMQEIKCTLVSADEHISQICDLGYAVHLNPHMEEGRHGVGFFVREGISHLHMMHTPGRSSILILEDGSMLMNVYVNQGQDIESPEYPIKLKFLSEIDEWIVDHQHSRLIICGDFNVCPKDEDVWSTDSWHHGVISRTPDEIDAFTNLLIGKNLRNLPVTNHVKFTWYSYRHTWRKYDDNKLVEHSGRYGTKCDHVITNSDSVSPITLLDYIRLPEIKSEFPTSDHVPMVFTILP